MGNRNHWRYFKQDNSKARRFWAIRYRSSWALQWSHNIVLYTRIRG